MSIVENKEIIEHAVGAPPQAAFLTSTTQALTRTELFFRDSQDFTEDSLTYPEVFSFGNSPAEPYFIDDLSLVDGENNPRPHLEVRAVEETQQATFKVRRNEVPEKFLSDTRNNGYRIATRQILNEVEISIHGTEVTTVGKFALDPTRVQSLHENGYEPVAWNLFASDGYIPGGQGGRQKGVVYFVHGLGSTPIVLTNVAQDVLGEMNSVEDFRARVGSGTSPKKDRLLMIALKHTERRNDKLIYVPGEFNSIIQFTGTEVKFPFSRNPYKAFF